MKSFSVQVMETLSQERRFQLLIQINFQTCYEEMKENQMGYRGSDNVRTENIDEPAESSVGFVQLFSDRAATTLKKTTKRFVSNSVILLNPSV